MSAAIHSTQSQTDPNDRLKELQQFDESKFGVKGLVDRGVATIPRFFVHQPDPNAAPAEPEPGTLPEIPVIDLSSSRDSVVEQIRESASKFGFFQVINHGVPLDSINHLLNSAKSFNEMPESEKMKYYKRDMSNGAAFSTNFDLYQSKAASWRDTLQVRLSPTPPDWAHVLEICRAPIVEWDKQVMGLGDKLLELLCEGVGLENLNALKELSCLEKRILVAHYYPYCPQPDLTAGLTSHTDPGVITALVQNEVPGLQVKVGEHWVTVEPVEGAIVINIGDILQIMSNDEYKSVEHRVIANPFKDPRVSVAVFFNPHLQDNLFGPLPELLSTKKPAHYRQFALSDYLRRFFSKELDGKTLTNYYRI